MWTLYMLLQCFIHCFALRFVIKTEILTIIVGFIANKAESSRLNIGATFPEGVQGHMQSPGEAELKRQKVI